MKISKKAIFGFAFHSHITEAVKNSLQIIYIIIEDRKERCEVLQKAPQLPTVMQLVPRIFIHSYGRTGEMKGRHCAEAMEI